MSERHLKPVEDNSWSTEEEPTHSSFLGRAAAEGRLGNYRLGHSYLQSRDPASHGNGSINVNTHLPGSWGVLVDQHMESSLTTYRTRVQVYRDWMVHGAVARTLWIAEQDGTEFDLDAPWLIQAEAERLEVEMRERTAYLEHLHSRLKMATDQGDTGTLRRLLEGARNYPIPGAHLAQKRDRLIEEFDRELRRMMTS